MLMMTSDEKKQLQTLRFLQKKFNDKHFTHDRFDKRFGHESTGESLQAELNEIKAQIDAIPERIHRMAEREDTLEQLGLLVERYILHRTCRFLPDVENLLDTILSLAQNHEIPQTAPRVAEVIACLAHLRTLDTSQEDIDVVILVAGNLDQYRAKPVLYLKLLMIATRTYLDRRAQMIEGTAPRGLAGLFSRAPVDKIEDLREALPEWKREIPRYRQDYRLWEALENSQDLVERVGYARFNLICQIQPLSRLGISDQVIEQRVFDIQKQWQTDHSKRRK
jgi:hypothetical protein